MILTKMVQGKGFDQGTAICLIVVCLICVALYLWAGRDD